MDFMLLDKEEIRAFDFDAREELVKKDNFFDRAKKYITLNVETILHRQMLFADILKCEALSTFLCELSEKLTEYEPLVTFHIKAKNREEHVGNILFPMVYINLVDFIYTTLSPIIGNVKSESVKRLYELAREDFASKEYKAIKAYYEKNAGKLNYIRSISIGVNLNATFMPKEAGILALHDEEFKSGDLLDRILRLDFAKDEFHCIAPLTTIDKKLTFQENQQINYAVLKALGSAVDNGLHHCGKRLLGYARKKILNYVKWQSSLAFVRDAILRIKIFQKKNIPLCFPKISTDRTFDFVSLYDDTLCGVKEKKEIVPNTARLESGVFTYILSGPNSGGKTVFLNSVGAAQYYFQLGMPIPAKSASLPICDAIYKVSVEKQKASNSAGRFEQECITLSKILQAATANSLVLIDEAFTSTSSSAAVPIAANFIAELSKIGAKCIFVTHYHELCESEPKIAECGACVDYLHATINGENRVYFIQKGKAEANSYAQGIAKKYGLL